jgi:pheromone a factor receptor
MVELSICVGLPLLEVALRAHCRHLISRRLLIIYAVYIVQGHRYNIFEDVGCLPAIYNVTWAFPIIYIPPLIMGVVAAGYSGTSIFDVMFPDPDMV